MVSEKKERDAEVAKKVTPIFKASVKDPFGTMLGFFPRVTEAKITVTVANDTWAEFVFPTITFNERKIVPRSAFKVPEGSKVETS